jgi:hypothetical protein
VENGLAQFGEEFRNGYADSTDVVPEHLVIGDRS